MISIPDLVALVQQATPEELPSLAGRLREAELLAELRLRSVTPTNGNGHAEVEPSPADDNISVEVAARRLGVSASYVYKNASELPFTIKIGRRLVCSARRLEQWNRARLSR